MTKKVEEIRKAVMLLSTLEEEEWEGIVEKIIEKKKLSESATNAEEVCEISEEDKQLIVTELLKEIGVPANIKGYYYIREAILLVIEDSDYLTGVTKVLYPEIAKKFDSTCSRVDRAIRHAIGVAWDRGYDKKQHEIFGNTISPEKGRPTNTEAIAAITDYLKTHIF